MAFAFRSYFFLTIRTQFEKNKNEIKNWDIIKNRLINKIDMISLSIQQEEQFNNLKIMLDVFDRLLEIINKINLLK